MLTNLLLSYEHPLRIFWVILGTYLALLYLPYDITAHEFVQHSYRSILIILVGWGLYNYVSQHSRGLFRFARKIEIDEDSMLIPFLEKIGKFLILAIIFVAVLSEWNIEIGTFIAGLGIGGLAFALAAQDTIGNFFGGVIIITEKPFSKGDWIETPTVEGTVEDITFRSTQIRTFADSLVTVPNSTLANEPITNWSLMGKRQISFNLAIDKVTSPDKLEQATEKKLRLI